LWDCFKEKVNKETKGRGFCKRSYLKGKGEKKIKGKSIKEVKKVEG